MERKTKQNWIVLDKLWPGATYDVNVSGISYGISSLEPHTYHQTLNPKPAELFQIVKFSNSSILLSWQAPIDSLVDSYIVRYKPFGSNLWQEQVVVNNITTTEIHDLLPGEKYYIKLNTISNKVESSELRELEQTLYPNAIESVSQLIASNNITFKILTTIGRVDYYIVLYNTVKGKFPTEIIILLAIITCNRLLVSLIKMLFRIFFLVLTSLEPKITFKRRLFSLCVG